MATPRPDPRPDDSLDIAFHEAAHAVVAILHDLPVSRVVLCGDRQDAAARGFVIMSPKAFTLDEAFLACRGRSAPTQARLADSDWPIVQHLISLLAGGAAERRLRGIGVDQAIEGDFDDRLKAEQLISELIKSPPHSRQVYHVESLVMAAAMRDVDREWPWVGRVAAALMDRGTLTGAEVVALRDPQ